MQASFLLFWKQMNEESLCEMDAIKFFCQYPMLQHNYELKSLTNKFLNEALSLSLLLNKQIGYQHNLYLYCAQEKLISITTNVQNEQFILFPRLKPQTIENLVIPPKHNCLACLLKKCQLIKNSHSTLEKINGKCNLAMWFKLALDYMSLHQIPIQTKVYKQKENDDHIVEIIFQNVTYVLDYHSHQVCLKVKNKLLTHFYNTFDLSNAKIIYKTGKSSIKQVKHNTERAVIIKTMKELQPKIYAQSLAFITRLDHPNLNIPYVVSYENNTVEMIMEQMSYTLKEFNTIGAGLHYSNHLKNKLFVLLEVAHGLNYMHRSGFVHRDIKSENVMVNYDYVRDTITGVKIIDFDLSLDVVNNKRYSTWVGTYGYMAPEIKDRCVNINLFKTDVYSFGVLIANFISNSRHYELTKFKHFTANNKAYHPNTLKQLYELCFQCTNVIPEERPDFSWIVKFLLNMYFTEINSNMEFFLKSNCLKFVFQNDAPFDGNEHFVLRNIIEYPESEAINIVQQFPKIIHCKDLNNNTLLHYAVFKNYHHLIRCLCEQNHISSSIVNNQNNSPITIAEHFEQSTAADILKNIPLLEKT